MRNIILQEFVTLDGLAAGPNASVDFVPASTRGDRSFEQHQLGFAETIDTILLVRVTVRMFADYWPTATMETDGSGTPLFGGDAPGLELKLLETKRFDRGAVVLKYTPSVRLQSK